MAWALGENYQLRRLLWFDRFSTKMLLKSERAGGANERRLAELETWDMQSGVKTPIF